MPSKLSSPRWAAWVALAAALAACRATASEPEDELRAATVLSFLRYSEWPGAPAGDHTLTVGVFGRPSLVATFRKALEDKTVENRLVRVLEFPAEPSNGCCQIVFFAGDKPGELKPALAAARSLHALTIGVSDQFLDLGGAIQLVLVDGHMSFEVDRDVLDRSGCTISSKLLRYGQVRKGGKARPPA